jgi:hypothetical protein
VGNGNPKSKHFAQRTLRAGRANAAQFHGRLRQRELRARSNVGEFFAENSDTGSFFLRQGDFKYIAFGHSFPWFHPAAYIPQLFNVTADPNEETNLAPVMPALAASMDAALVAALGRSYEDIDAEVMRNDLLIFQEYLTANMTLAQVRKMLADTYKNFDEDDWNKIQLWNASTPSASTAAASSGAKGWLQGGSQLL